MKKIIKRRIFSKDFGYNDNISFSDLPKDIRDNDIIEINIEDPYYSENMSHDGYMTLIVYRESEETDEEYEKRISDGILIKEELRKRRYENYLKLKSEFEPK